MNDSEWSLDQVALLNASAVNEVVTEEVEELKLVAGELGMLDNEPIDRTRHCVWKAFENLDPRMWRMNRRNGAFWC